MRNTDRKRTKDVAGIRVLTPPIIPGSRTRVASSAAGGAKGSSTAGGAKGSSAPELGFADFYDAAKAAYAPQLVEVEAFDRDRQAASLQAWLRPTYDRAIADRETRTDAARAELDADALARNMGTSAYVTDVKSRMHNAEARDVAALEAQFGAEVEKYLLETEQAYADRKTEVDIFNAGEWNDAMTKAYDSAMTLYNNYLSAVSSSGGRSRRIKAAASFADVDRRDQLEANKWAFERLGDAGKDTIYTYLSGLCTPEERDQIYYGNSPLYANIRAEILKSLGTVGTRQLHYDVPGNERHSTDYVR